MSNVIEESDKILQEVIDALESVEPNSIAEEKTIPDLGKDDDPEIGELPKACKRYQELIKQRDAIEAEIGELKLKLVGMIGAGNSFSYGGQKFTVTNPSSSRRFDSKSFREKNPDLYEEYKIQCPIPSTLRVTNPKKEWD